MIPVLTQNWLIKLLEIFWRTEMTEFTKCPNCAKSGLSVPLSEDSSGLVCSLCNYPR